MTKEQLMKDPRQVIAGQPDPPPEDAPMAAEPLAHPEGFTPKDGE